MKGSILSTAKFQITLLLNMTMQEGLSNSIDPNCESILRRRYDINDYGYPHLFHGWADVQGQGAANDYCRFVGVAPHIYLSCALAGTSGKSENYYNSQKSNFDVGFPRTWYMKDEDLDGRDDYCRCVGNDKVGYQVICTKAGPNGFYGSTEQGGESMTFTTTGMTDCKDRMVRPEFGMESGFTINTT